MLIKEKVIVLKTVRYGDSDLIVNCLTPQGARLSLFARSALKSKKRFGGGVLEPTHYIHVLYDDKTSKGAGDGHLHTLKEASLIEDFPRLRTDYNRIELGLHLVQLVANTVREGDVNSTTLFNLLGNALKATEESHDLAKLKTHFEIKLLADQGVLPPEKENIHLVRTPISEHERLQLNPYEWNVLRQQVRQCMDEYFGK